MVNDEDEDENENGVGKFVIVNDNECNNNNDVVRYKSRFLVFVNTSNIRTHPLVS